MVAERRRWRVRRAEGRGERKGNGRPVPGVAEVVGEPSGVEVLPEVPLHGEEDIAPLRGPMQVVAVGIEWMTCRILVGIGFVSSLVETDLELQNGVVPGGEFAEGEREEFGRVEGVHVGEPVLAVQPGGGCSPVPLTKQSETGEKVVQTGECDLFPGGGEERLAGNR